MPFPVDTVQFEYDATVTMSDGLPLHINVYRPKASGRYPVIITHGIYGKDVLWQTAPPYQAAWEKMSQKLPGLCDGSTCQFMRWEMPDPERWVPQGYVVIHADSRGAGKTPGYLDPLGARETQDYKELIEWAAQQPWSSGKVGLLGISYYAINQWQVAALQPKGLAAIIPWEGAFDAYRDMSYHGGIASTLFSKLWMNTQILPNQHGNGASPFVDAITGGPAAGAAIPETVLRGSASSLLKDMLAHPYDDAYYAQRTPRAERIVVPTLSAGNWSGAGLHLRGNLEAYQQIAAQQKWLRVHTGDHFSPFYAPQSFAVQKAFFDRFLKGDETAFPDEPRVMLTIRDPKNGFRERAESAWPIERTEYQRWYLDANQLQLHQQLPQQGHSASYAARSDGLSFVMPAADTDREFTGPLMAHLWVSTSSADADFFLTLRLLDPTGRDVTFEGANAPAVPVTQGWLRLSQRAQDPARSLPYRPWHAHQAPQAVVPGDPYPIDVEIWPTSIVVPAGYRLVLTIQGQDFSFPHLTEGLFRGSAPFLHEDRDPTLYGGTNTILSGPQQASFLLLPFIPATRQDRGGAE
ncbi:CocE/NonD family hydrolase [Corticibacter populi]|uniref:CocE/NonD family hydrolase n=2 Tax=Corticibacter populi TaxID=1550736 RepID=A0A3M6QKM0_9BURK|nr:CocE/NonD family hydrolase [Corticibacter populi]